MTELDLIQRLHDKKIHGASRLLGILDKLSGKKGYSTSVDRRNNQWVVNVGDHSVQGFSVQEATGKLIGLISREKLWQDT